MKVSNLIIATTNTVHFFIGKVMGRKGKDRRGRVKSNISNSGTKLVTRKGRIITAILNQSLRTDI